MVGQVVERYVSAHWYLPTENFNELICIRIESVEKSKENSPLTPKEKDYQQLLEAALVARQGPPSSSETGPVNTSAKVNEDIVKIKPVVRIPTAKADAPNLFVLAQLEYDKHVWTDQNQVSLRDSILSTLSLKFPNFDRNMLLDAFQK